MNAVLENPEKVWTREDYLGLDDEVRFEIIGGKTHMSPSPELVRQRRVLPFLEEIERPVETHKLGAVPVAPINVVPDPTEGIVQSPILPGLELDLAQWG